MGYRHNTGQNETIADVASGTTDAHTLVASVCAAAASDVDALIGNGGVGVMKVSRSIRKEWDRAILIAFATVMLVVCISPVLTSATYIPPDPTDLVNTTGRYWVNYTWQAGSGWYLITGEADGGFYGYNRTGSSWQSDSGIVSGLPDIGTCSAPTVFRKGDEWYLIAGEADGGFHGYNRTGSSWQSDGRIISGLPDVGNYSAPTVFRKGDEWYLIAGEADGGFHGYNWTGSSWQSDSAIISDLPDADLPDAADHLKPTVFRKGGEWYLVAGAGDGGFYGYNRTGSSWQSDSGIVSDLPDVGNYSAPTVFRKGDEWYLVAGAADGGFHGYNWAGSSWQSDGVIASGLPDAMDGSTPAVFDMGGNVTDSYNISVNGTWYNGTTNTFINETIGSGGWLNITIWAWNTSGTGTLSAVYISDNVQAPKDLLSTFGLVGSVPTGGSGGSGGTYPPGWLETPTPAVTATKAPTPSTTATATSAPPGEYVTATKASTKAKPAAAKATEAAAEGTATGTAKNGLPGFTAVFVITGMLAVAYAMMRRSG
ncbi:hypothetical protein DRO03_07055 [Methanosarcinales archaeon]|nr:MAG: hypothetical protein DRO03_07055 [Methanosarcinales archaeon]